MFRSVVCVEPVFVKTVESGLISGAVVCEPEPLDKPADGNLLVCCSQPMGDVVIDL
jgi:hypothetical protein